MAVAQTLAETVADRLPLLVLSIASLFLTYVVRLWSTSNPLANVPCIGQEIGGPLKRREAYVTRARALYLEGYAKVWIRTSSISGSGSPAD